MALIKCPECGKEISSYAQVCIHCGYPLQKLGAILPKKDNNQVKSDNPSEKDNTEPRKPTGPCPICHSTSQAIYNSNKLRYQCKICGYIFGSLANEDVINQIVSVPIKKTVRVSKKPIEDRCPNCLAPSSKFELSKKAQLKYVCAVCGHIFPFNNGIDVEEYELDDYIGDFLRLPETRRDLGDFVRRENEKSGPGAARRGVLKALSRNN